MCRGALSRGSYTFTTRNTCWCHVLGESSLILLGPSSQRFRYFVNNLRRQRVGIQLGLAPRDAPLQLICCGCLLPCRGLLDRGLRD